MAIRVNAGSLSVPIARLIPFNEGVVSLVGSATGFGIRRYFNSRLIPAEGLADKTGY